MAKQIITAAATLFAVTLFSCDGIGQIGSKKIVDPKDKFSYAIGLQMGGSLVDVSSHVNVKMVIAGIQDTIDKKGNRMTDKEVAAIMDTMMKVIQKEKMEEMQKKAVENKKAADDFFTKNKSKAGVVTTATGLQYEVITKGTGPLPTATDEVKVNYVGTLLVGKEVDSSIKRGQPATFKVGMVIPGWTEGIQLMPVGSKYKFYIPPTLGYGERGAGPVIPPNSALIFEVELLEIVKADAVPAAPGTTAEPAKPAVQQAPAKK